MFTNITDSQAPQKLLSFFVSRRCLLLKSTLQYYNDIQFFDGCDFCGDGGTSLIDHTIWSLCGATGFSYNLRASSWEQCNMTLYQKMLEVYCDLGFINDISTYSNIFFKRSNPPRGHVAAKKVLCHRFIEIALIIAFILLCDQSPNSMSNHMMVTLQTTFLVLNI